MNNTDLYKRLFLTVVVALASICVSAKITPATEDSLQRCLLSAATPADSVRILFSMYDVNSELYPSTEARDKRLDILNRLYGVALRAGDTLSAYDALRYMSTEARYDTKIIDRQLRRMRHLPPSKAKLDTETFLKVQKYYWTLRDTTLTDNELRIKYAAIRKEVDKSKGSKALHDRIAQQFALVLYGSNLIDPEQMDKYLTDLADLVDMVKDHRSQLKGYFYRIAALLYDENERAAQSNLADNITLQILESHDSLNRAAGRYFRNYDVQRFAVYRRMLSNYRVMAPDSIEMIYQRINELMNSLPPHQVSDIDREAVSAMWNLYKKNYKKSIVSFRNVLSDTRYRNKPGYIKGYILAASQTGNVDDMKNGVELYTKVLINRAKDAANTEYTKLKIEYEIDSLVTESREARRQAIEANKRSDEVARDYFVYALLGLGLLLLVVLIIQIIANNRQRRMAKRLEDTNQSLFRERNALTAAKNDLEEANLRVRQAMQQKSEFIHSVSYEISEPVKAMVGYTQLILDSVPEERRQYLSRFMNIIEHNGSILQRIAGDVLSTAEFDNAVSTVNVSHFKPEEVINLTTERFRSRLNDRQTLVVEPIRIIDRKNNNDRGIDTDAMRLEQILVNLLGNAVKFCDEGEIKVSSEINYDSGIMTMAVTDQGPGIPAGKEELVFERYEKIGSFSTGLGLGLYVCRIIARLMEGEVKVDTTYRRGARFVVTLPISIRPTTN